MKTIDTLKEELRALYEEKSRMHKENVSGGEILEFEKVISAKQIEIFSAENLAKAALNPGGGF